MNREEYIKLFEKFERGECSREEEEQLLRFDDAFKFQQTDSRRLSVPDKQLRSLIYHRIANTLSQTKSYARNFAYRGWWAAALAVFCIGLAYYMLSGKMAAPQGIVSVDKNKLDPITPGKNSALLTLSNGAQINLDEVDNGVLVQSGNITIKKTEKGELIYTYDGPADAGDDQLINTVTVPMGGQYTVILPDNTKVWLNAASSLSYPMRFNGEMRKVDLKGEAYFEVAQNKNSTFIVHTNQADIKVLGTHFNVNAYPDEPYVKTTLVEGAVRLLKGADSVLLKPGQQAVIDTSADRMYTQQVNTRYITAWKSGYFIFKNDDITSIMKQIGRWYNVDIVYLDHLQGKKFGGIFSKNKDLDDLLKSLELTGSVHFEVKERRIMVMR